MRRRLNPFASPFPTDTSGRALPIRPRIPFHYLCDRGLAPTIQDADLELLEKGRPDFLGVNYYQTLTYEANPPDGVSEGAINTTGQKGISQDTGIPGLYKTSRNPYLETTS